MGTFRFFSAIVAWTVASAVMVAAWPDGAEARSRFGEWVTLHHDRLGLRIAYPVEVFSERSRPTDENARLLVSRDGRARMVVGAFENSDGISLPEYRAYLLKQNYAGARVTFAPVYRRWFILTGYRDGNVFYQRVAFSCRGRLISSWAMLYPASQKRFYDRIVEQVAPTFLPGEKSSERSCR